MGCTLLPTALLKAADPAANNLVLPALVALRIQRSGISLKQTANKLDIKKRNVLVLAVY